MEENGAGLSWLSVMDDFKYWRYSTISRRSCGAGGTRTVTGLEDLRGKRHEVEGSTFKFKILCTSTALLN